VLCSRDARERAGQRARWVEVGFVGLVITACGALFAARALRAPPVVESVRGADRAPAAEVTLAAERTKVELPAAALPAVDLAENKPDLQPEPAVLAASAISSVSAPAPSSERVPSVRVTSASELQAALRATPVSMFTTSWCPHCERARRFFQANGVRVMELDIDADARAAAELKRRTGGKAVPLIDVDGVELRGFNQQAAADAVVASVERRVGVAGLKLSVASVRD
jgi:glutaredoxin 3